MPLSRDRFALNAIQWINVKEDPSDPNSASLWLYEEPRFRADYPGVLKQISAAGFGATMMEVLGTQTLQDYARMVTDAGLVLAPGYCSITLPEDHGVTLTPGSAEHIHWFDGVRRKAEESNYFGLDTIFIAPEVSFEPWQVRTSTAVGVGHAADAGRLERMTDMIGQAAEVLRSEGIRAGLHNHVGTWIETEDEIEHVLGAIDPALLGASFDVGHLAWAGIDPVSMLTRHADRIIDLHIKDLDLTIAAQSRAVPSGYAATTDAGIFLEPGLGTMDLPGMLGALPEDFGGWIIVEVDRASMDPFESAKVSWAWVEATNPA